MSNAYTTDHLKNVFAFPFKDPRWQEKLIIAAGLSLLSFLLLPYFFVAGYIYEIMRRIIVDREAPSLPDWDDWGTYFINGFKLFAMSVIYLLPGLIVMIFSQLFFVFFMGMTEAGGSEEVFLPLIGMPVFYGAIGVGMILMFISMLVMMVGMGHMVAKDEFGAAFHFKEMWPIFRKNVAGYLIAFVLVMGLYWVVMMVSQVLVFTVILCCLYPIVALAAQVYLMLVGSVLFAQAYLEGVDNSADESTTAAELIEEAIKEAEEDPPAD